MGTLAQACRRLTESPPFQRVILATILLAAVVVGLETSSTVMATWGRVLHTFDAVVLGVFILEVVLKLLARWPRPQAYFTDGWNVFDFVIVALCLLPVGDTHFAAVLRLARILRVLRLVTALPKLQVLVGALVKSIPSMSYVGLLLGIHFYIYAVLGVFLFGPRDPAHFGSLGSALLTLFQVVTLEGWVDFMRVQMPGTAEYLAASAAGLPPGPHPWVAPVFFVSFILLGTMIMLNLFIGVVINGMTEAQAEQLQAKHAREQGGVNLEGEIALLQQQLDALRKQLDVVRVAARLRPKA